ncbi:MAG: endonuclease III [Prevotellaceae bacterium]|jgi:endonuclease-3|nr:endonuclease III [Prevotellaceae bacterium]
MNRKQKHDSILNWFRQNMPTASTELHYQNPYQLIVAVILSAQCTDKRVNLVTVDFFARYPDPKTLAKAEIQDIYETIKSVSYPNNKAKHLLGMVRMLIADFGGKVPDNIADLQQLPGVGRKTANVILSVAFNKPAMAVDTHVFRVSARLGLTSGAKNPAETERQLVSLIPENELSVAHHWLILHGRYVCLARKPKCEVCGVNKWCDYNSKKIK